MCTIVGYRDVNFTSQQGNEITGMTIYYTETDVYGVSGQACDKFFMSSKRLKDIGWKPAVGDNVELNYNKYGKVAGVVLY